MADDTGAVSMEVEKVVQEPQEKKEPTKTAGTSSTQTKKNSRVIDSDDEDTPLPKRPAAASAPTQSAAQKTTQEAEGEDTPLSKKKEEPAKKPAEKPKSAATSAKAPAKKQQASSSEDSSSSGSGSSDSDSGSSDDSSGSDESSSGSESSSEDERPLKRSAAKKAAPAKKPAAAAPAKKAAPAPKRKAPASSEEEEEESSDDEPLSKKKAPAAKKPAAAAAAKSPAKGKAATPAAKAKAVKKEEDSDSDDKPLSSKKAAPAAKKAKTSETTAKTTKAAAAKKVKKEEEEEGDEKKTPAKKGKAAASGKGKEKAAAKSEEEGDEDDEGKWWKQSKEDVLAMAGKGKKKWNSLEHNGVMFPPAYEPHGVPIKYEGKTIHLDPEAEEVATMFAVVRELSHYTNPVFRKNFFADWQKILKAGKKEQHVIKDLDKVDFDPIWEWYTARKAAQKSTSSEEKKRLKEEKAKEEEPFLFATVDGRKEKVGNFRVEPPGLFRGRGAHPKAGMLKARVQPEEITINIGEDAKIPSPPPGHEWKEVVHDHNATWLAMWRESINGSYKYVFLAPTSTFKGISDMAKFEIARELKDKIAQIRKDYTKQLKSEDPLEMQRATALYFIDKLALRAGNEKDEDQADTVGCCSLRCEHITLESPNVVNFDFLGKDSIRYQNSVKVEDQVYKNLKKLMKGKEASSDIFDCLDTASLNKYLRTLMDKLTAKVFRTCNASTTLQNELAKMPEDTKMSVNEKVVFYNRANREVAILCNHQRTLPKSHATQMGKMNEKKADLVMLRDALLAAKKTWDKKDRSAAERAFEEAEDERQEKWEEAMKKELEAKAAKGGSSSAASPTPAKKEEEPKKGGKKAVKKEEEASSDEEPISKKRGAKKVKKEEEEEEESSDDEPISKKGKKKATTKKEDSEKTPSKKRASSPTTPAGTTREKKFPRKALPQSVPKLNDLIEATNAKIEAVETQMQVKDDLKTVALGTSKLNYLDPRITVAWCKKWEVPIEKVFNKSLITKFPWAMEVDEDYEF